MPDQQKYTSKLSGTRVLILGGTSGIGYACAEALLEQNSTVILSSSNPTRISSAVSSLRSAYPSRGDAAVTGHACNLLPSDNVETQLEANIVALLNAATSEGKEKLDHIVFTAGDPLAIHPLKETTFARIQQAGTVRFYAPLLVAKHAPSFLHPGPASSLVLTTGTVSERPMANWSIVGSFATGLQGMCRSLALDLAPVRVNLVSPGAVDTELWGGMAKEVKEGMFESIRKTVPTGVVGRAQDVAEAYLYFMRDWNCTGVMVSTNSGSLLK